MEKGTLVRQGICTLIGEYLGDATAKNFLDFHESETLPIFTNEALSVLGDFIGKDKAQDELRQIYAKNEMTRQNV